MMRLVYLIFVVLLFTHCDARKSVMFSKMLSSPNNQNMKHLKILDLAKNLNMLLDVSVKDSSNAEPYVSSPFSLPPYDYLAPESLPENSNTPPFCVYPPPNPQTPSTTIPSPVDYNPTPPSSPPPSSPTNVLPSPTTPDLSPSPPSIISGPPENEPNPPNYEPSPPSRGDIPSPSSGNIPSPPSSGDIPSPSSGDIPTPPQNVPSPIGFEPSPPVFEPSPPVFEPPVVYPPPTVLPSPPGGGGGHGSGGGVWCVAKPSVPDPIIQEAMNYACGSGADCGPIQPNGQCYHPNTLLAHASYAFNSYWQRTKVAGATCSFGGTAILVTVNPSSQGCHFDST
ncbi:circumsporozoite protein-like isoform X2 [Chenopodium quinoa]|uniref:circumsporozoite protein-like isoform X2 n=1 Tax=Chenopodium quinoa TaxID=63459 RepID=UPI000B7853FE|nr:circumsporozoite protein-like isoform X2 [Chenopodium quinoa]